MKTILCAAFSVVFIASVSGQVRTGYNTYGSFSGYGSVAFPGTGHPPAPGNFSITSPRFASSLGRTVNGSLYYRNSARRRGYGAYAYPIFVGSPYPYIGDESAPPQQDPGGAYMNGPSQVPQVIINQNFGPVTPPAGVETASADGVRIYSAPASAPADEPASHTYLIAFKDHSLYSAESYWIEDSTLHYVTPQHTHNQASLDLVDMDLTKRLNLDRNQSVSVNPSR